MTIDEDYGNLRSNVILYGQVIPRGLTRQEADELESIHFDDLKEVWVNPESKDKVLEIPTSVIMNYIESGNRDAYLDQVNRLSRSM
uniref:hypothetical protein n=1 Tax=Halovenus aranensis TaxID=890420 RepID=UPI00117A0042